MNKGFTLVEMLAVILILGIIFLIGVPIYQGVRKSTNESIYESKISNVKSKAEKYSSESGTFIYDIRYMIKEGLLTPDNESGEYLDPRTGRDMQCDLVRIELVDESYYANVEETTSCYDIEDLQNMSSVVKIVFYKTSDGEEAYPNGWIRANTVYAGYTVPEGVTVTKATWGGGWNEVNGRLEITASEILNVPVILNIEFTYNDQPYSQTISRKVMLDIQSPVSNVTVPPGTEKIPTLAYVEWRLSDGDGSGVAGHILLNESQYNAKKCESYSPEEIPDNDKTNVGYHLKNDTYYVCVKDKVGNITKNNDAEASKVQVTNVDQSSGDIESFNVISRHPLYKTMDVKLEIILKEEETSGYTMCISHTGYLENCTWEEYKESKDYTITGYEYGEEVPFYLSIKDEAGNISNKDTYYTTDAKQILDLNGKLNDTIQNSIIGLGKCDIYINGELAVANTDFHFKEYPPGTTYEIKNIKSVDNSKYKYVSHEGELTGTIGRARTDVRLNYVELYTIKYDKNGGTGSIANQTKEYGKPITLSTSGMTRDNYNLIGWNAKADGTGANYALGGNFNGNANTTLYAKWDPNIMTVSLDNQSAKTAGTTKVYYKYTKNKYYSNSAATTEMTAISKPTKDGYTYDGYYTSTNGGGTQYINASGGFVNSLYNKAGNTTLYAKWKANTITITLDKQSGTGGSSNIFYAYNTNAYYSNNTLATSLSGKITVPSRTGHTFKGYYSGKNGSGTQYVDATGKIVGNLYKAYASNATIYAYWTVNSYVVTWNNGGGSCNKTSQSVNYGAAIGTLPTCTKANNTFQGWFTASAGGTKISTSTTVTQAVTYYAQWKPNNYTITYNANGGSGSMANQTVTSGNTVTLTANSFTHERKVFGGWATSSGGAVAYKNKASVKPTSNLTLYAVWKDYEMHMEGTSLIVESKYVINARYTTFYGGGCGDHHEHYSARIGLIYGGFTAGMHKLTSDSNVHYLVAGDKYLWSSSGYNSKCLQKTYYMPGISSEPSDTNITFSGSKSGYLRQISFSTGAENTAVKYCTGSSVSTCIQVASKYSYTHNITELSCNHNDLRSSTPRYCDLLVSFRGVLENYDTSKGYPTGIGLHLDEVAEEGGGPGSDGGTNACCVTTLHRNLSLS